MSFTVGRSYQVREMSCHYATCSFRSQPVGSQSPSISPRVRTPNPPPPPPFRRLALPLASPLRPSSFLSQTLWTIFPLPLWRKDAAVEEPMPPTLRPHRALDAMAWNACSLRNKVDEHLESVMAGMDVFGGGETLGRRVNLKRMEGYHHHGISTECVASWVGR
jgi:hypothetical protein